MVWVKKWLSENVCRVCTMCTICTMCTMWTICTMCTMSTMCTMCTMCIICTMWTMCIMCTICSNKVYNQTYLQIWQMCQKQGHLRLVLGGFTEGSKVCLLPNRPNWPVSFEKLKLTHQVLSQEPSMYFKKRTFNRGFPCPAETETHVLLCKKLPDKIHIYGRQRMKWMKSICKQRN